jgi:aminoglycoside phosphotransferase (APT) family kinase protein
VLDVGQAHEVLARHYAKRSVGRRQPTVSDVAEIPGGLSNGMYPFTLQRADGASERRESLVLRVGHDKPQLAREFDALRRLQPTSVPVPVVYDVDEDLHGWNFGIMERVDGVNLWEALDGLAHAEATDLLKQFFGVLAEIHTSDWRRMGLDSLDVPDGVHGYVDRLLAGYRHEAGWLGTDALDPVLDWMEANRPPSDHYVLLHGDYHGGNVIADGGAIVAVVDWECVSIGDAANDLCWMPLLWRAFGGADDDQAGLLMQHYREAVGRDVGNLEFYLAARAVRLLLYMMMTTAHGARGGPRRPGAEIMLLSEPPLRCAEVLQQKTGIDISSAVAAALDGMREGDPSPGG